LDNLNKCKLYYEDSPNYLVQFRGNFKKQIDKVSYACGDTITNSIGVISTPEQNLDTLLKDVPTITFIDPRYMYVLQDTSPTSVDNINAIKSNPYLSLTGKGVLVGMIDTGIDYLNEEFIRDDGTSRIISIWDQSIQDGQDTSVYIGDTYTNEQINNAITAYKNNGDPYKIVPSKDSIGHGTNVAGVIGARGVNPNFQGIAPDCDFVIVKLFESINFKNKLQKNSIEYTPTYNGAEVLAGIEYLKNFSIKAKKPMVIYLGVGTTEGGHDGNNLISKYISSLGSFQGIITVIGVGNEGASSGHTSGYIHNLEDISSVSLKIPRDIDFFSFNIWVRKPNVASLKIIPPSKETSDFIKAKSNKTTEIRFVLLDTKASVKYYSPEYFTGHEVINVVFEDIKQGIWKFELKGEYLTDGRYDIWLPPEKTLSKGIGFLNPDPFTTLTTPSTARKVVTVAYSGDNNTLIAASGEGFNSNNLINPDITTLGLNILTTKPGGDVTVSSGSSIATGIIAGACALLLQWGIIEGNDPTMYAAKVRSYLIHGADRSNLTLRYPNRKVGYGFFDLLNTFNTINKTYTEARSTNNDFIEYHINKVFIRINKHITRNLK